MSWVVVAVVYRKRYDLILTPFALLFFFWFPLRLGVNYFYSHRDDKTRRNGPARAAGLTRALMYFRQMTESYVCLYPIFTPLTPMHLFFNSQQLEPEMARTTPLCMASYKYLFNATRLPTAPSDTARKYDPETHNHVVVVRKNKFYEVPVVHSTGEWLSEKELEV